MVSRRVLVWHFDHAGERFSLVVDGCMSEYTKGEQSEVCLYEK